MEQDFVYFKKNYIAPFFLFCIIIILLSKLLKQW